MLLEEVLIEISIPIPSTYSFWAFKHCDYKLNTFAVAGHWETVVECIENIEKHQQWLILPKNCLRTQLWFNQNIRSSIQKVPMTAPSGGSLWYPQWKTTMDNNGRQSAVLHASLMPLFFWLQNIHVSYFIDLLTLSLFRPWLLLGARQLGVAKYPYDWHLEVSCGQPGGSLDTGNL